MLGMVWWGKAWVSTTTIWIKGLYGNFSPVQSNIVRTRLVTCPISSLIPASSALYCHCVSRKRLLVTFPWSIWDLDVLVKKIPGWVVQCAVCHCSGDLEIPKEIRPWATVQISVVPGTTGVLLSGSIWEEKSPVTKQQGELIVTFKPLLSSWRLLQCSQILFSSVWIWLFLFLRVMVTSFFSFFSSFFLK